MLDQHNITSKPDLHRLFAPYANTDPENGIGIHNFKIRSYIGDERSGLIRWEWSPEHAAAFLGLVVAGKPFGTQGHTFHQYNEKGLITRESSWWDAAAVVRQVGPVSPDKLPAGPASSAGSASNGGRPSQASAADGLPYAQRWCEALGRDTAALGELYADYFTLEFGMVDDHLNDTITDRQMLSEKLGGLASGDNGRYTFTATEWLGDERYGLIHWNVRIEHADSFRGIPAEGKTLESSGSTFLQFRPDGKILLESTYWNDNPIFQQLGLPVQTPHYWDENFDPAALAAA
jgi:steroid delta-isomerase-like uncharacterized protein